MDALGTAGVICQCASRVPDFCRPVTEPLTGDARIPAPATNWRAEETSGLLVASVEGVSQRGPTGRRCRPGGGPREAPDDAVVRRGVSRGPPDDAVVREGVSGYFRPTLSSGEGVSRGPPADAAVRRWGFRGPPADAVVRSWSFTGPTGPHGILRETRVARPGETYYYGSSHWEPATVLAGAAASASEADGGEFEGCA